MANTIDRKTGESKDTKNLMSLGQIRPTENFFEAKKDKYEVSKTP